MLKRDDDQQAMWALWGVHPIFRWSAGRGLCFKVGFHSSSDDGQLDASPGNPVAIWRCASIIESNGNLPPNLDHGIRRQPEILTQMRGIALHHHETRRHPFRQSFAIVAGENRLVTNIIGDIRKIDATATRMGLSEQRRNIRPFHKSIPGGRTPKLRGNFRHREALGIVDPRDRLRVYREHEQALV